MVTNWKEMKLGDIVEVFDNLRIPVTESLREKGQTPYYGANGIQDYVKGHTHDGEFVLLAEDGANDLLNYPIQYVSGQIWVNNHAHVIKGKTGVAVTKFLGYALKAVDFQSVLVGGTRAKLNGSVMREINITIPKVIAEQRRIAEALSDTDALITALEKLIAKKRAIKQGAMQELLTSIRRLSGFEGEWVENSWEDVLDGFSSGATPYRGKPEYYTGPIKWVSSGELKYKLIFDTNEHISCLHK